MNSEDLCPATGRECHNSLCEFGGCRKARSKQPPKKSPARAASVANIAVDAAAKRVAKEIEEAAKLKIEVATMFADAIEALEHGDAALTYLQMSLGVKTSPRLDLLRSVASRMREFLCKNRLPAPPQAEANG